MNDINKKELEEKIFNIQKQWANSIVSIGKAFLRKKDYLDLTNKFLDKLYYFNKGNVLFKPTKCESEQFRPTKLEALSYFIAGSFDEDNGFALKPWAKIELDEEPNIRLIDDYAYAMGLLNFYPLKSEDYSKVVFTFILKKFSNNLKLILHHSSPVPISKLQF